MAGKILLLFFIIFAHIIDDYYLQGILAKMKQKEWWEQLPNYNSFYKYDYIVALIVHGFSWSMSIHIPIMVYEYYFMHNTSPKIWFLIIHSIIVHSVLHAWVDNIKANEKDINLIIDQICHLIQTILAWLFIVVL